MLAAGCYSMSNWLVNRLRCVFGDHNPRTHTYKGIATSAGTLRHPECCRDGWIQMERTRCETCGTELACHPVEYAED